MAIVKKGSRKIVVDGFEYRWRVRQKPTHSQGVGSLGVTCSVERAGMTSGTVLVINFNQYHISNWLGLKSEPILPSQVAAAIHDALAKGWQPAQAGVPFQLAYNDIE
jgi:hypothetical protein